MGCRLFPNLPQMLVFDWVYINDLAHCWVSFGHQHSKAPFHVILMLNMYLNKKAKRIAKDINDTLVKLRVISDGFLDIKYSFNISNIIGMVKGIERLIIVVAVSGSNSNTSSCCSEKFREK